jgi:hypothetical protein
MRPRQHQPGVKEEAIVPYTRLYADAEGESHFEDVAFAFNLMDLVPSAPPVHIASFGQAKQVVFRRAPAGFDAGQHQAPVCQLVVVLAGAHEIAASDGAVRQFAPGSVLLAEDTIRTYTRMRCPKCGEPLEEMHELRVKVDACAACGGIRLDQEKWEVLVSSKESGWLQQLFKGVMGAKH